MMNKVEMLFLAFQYYNSIDIDQARELLVNSVDSLVYEVNINEQVRPYLIYHPFKPKNVDIKIFLQNPDGSTIKPGKLIIAKAAEGRLEYKIRDPKTDRLTTIYSETSLEAKAKLKETYQ